jgi:hypothetical protein
MRTSGIAMTEFWVNDQQPSQPSTPIFVSNEFVNFSSNLQHQRPGTDLNFE